MYYDVDTIVEGGKTKFVARIQHKGLGKSRIISGTVLSIVDRRAEAQIETWEAAWQAKCQKEKEIKQKARSAQEKQAEKERKFEEAESRTEEAEHAINEIKNTLKATLTINDKIDWDSLIDRKEFDKPAPLYNEPAKPIFPPCPPNIPEPDMPRLSDFKYKPKFTFLDAIFKSQKEAKNDLCRAAFKNDYKNWKIETANTKIANADRIKKWENERQKIADNYPLSINKALEKYSFEHAAWLKEKNEFLKNQSQIKVEIEKRKNDYLQKSSDAILEYCDMVLSNSKYPDFFQKEWDLDYNSETRTLIVEYVVPPPDALPTLKEVRFIQTKDIFKETHLPEKEREALYDSLLYQIALRTVHELYEADTADALDAIAFSGLVTSLDKTTGHNVTACILSVLARKDSFMHINLAKVDPKACFKSLKGVAASKLSGLAPIPPVMVMNKDDRRFVECYGVVDSINEGTNLATMDWEDFEHLIREVFEQEFVAGGGEVKVTQASRDGGVDAVAFDPDPIRGGKIVIQAKRYANTVGVSAVRDLYGTVMNEGATKGILVTTADYGPDAYEFANGKPLSLLNGSNLLHLLEKHGHQARINLSEAKLENKQR